MLRQNQSYKPTEPGKPGSMFLKNWKRNMEYFYRSKKWDSKVVFHSNKKNTYKTRIRVFFLHFLSSHLLFFQSMQRHTFEEMSKRWASAHKCFQDGNEKGSLTYLLKTEAIKRSVVDDKSKQLINLQISLFSGALVSFTM